jgi:hypothetical protein
VLRAFRVRIAQNSQVAAAADLNRRGGVLRSSGCLAYKIGKGLKVVTAGLQGGGIGLKPDHIPASRSRQTFTVALAQVITMRFGECGQWAEHRGAVGIDICQRRHSGSPA